MEINLNITPETIEKEIISAIIKSSIGKHIEQSVAKAVGGYSFDRQVEDAVKETVKDMIRTELLNNHDLKEQIKNAIAEKLTSIEITEVYKKLMDQITY